MTDEPRMPFWAKCSKCSHCWKIAYLPMEITKAAKLMLSARCPMCGDKKPVVAKQKDGALREQAA